MRINNNLSDKDITLTDLDRGNAGSNDPNTGINESWNAKGYTVVPAGGSIDVFDTDRTLLSSELGQVKVHVGKGNLSCDYSITGTEVGEFLIAGTNDTFEVDVAGGGFQSFTIPTGTKSMADVVSAINATASGFTAEESDGFFRSSNMDNTVKGDVDGVLAVGTGGQRTEAIKDGFLVLVSSDILTIGGGNANGTLGFHEKQLTTAKSV
ncbi:hypothetical protein N9948_01535 [bacterium]|nr:hypothetical protein [bacterium]